MLTLATRKRRPNDCQSEERFRQFAENSADIFWILNAKTQQLEYINQIYEKMFGQPRELVMHDRKRRLDLVVPEDRQEAATGLPRVHLLVKLSRAITASFGRATASSAGFATPVFRSATQQGNVVRIAGRGDGM